MAATRRKRTRPATAAPHAASVAVSPWWHVWLGPATLAITFVVLAAATWRKWPDLLVDFGQQLYIPWQLANGKRLYSDIAFLHGPLSQYFNAFLFRLFGPSLTVLVFTNLAILAAMTAAIFATIRLFADRLTATWSCLTFLALFGFAQYVWTGNYNFVCPYVHEATHGIALSAGLIVALSCYLTRGGRTICALAGLCLGLAVLTKVDVAIAAVCVVVVAVGLRVLISDTAGPLRPTAVATFALTALLPPLAFLLYFLTYLPLPDALRAVAGGFSALSASVAANPFYLRTAGLDDVGGNLKAMFEMCGWIVTFAGALSLVDLAAGRSVRRLLAAQVALGAAVFLFLASLPELFPWPDLPRALPLTTLVAVAAFATLSIRYRRDPSIWNSLAPMLLWSTFALALLAKIALNTHVNHYGFYLAMPATLVLVVSLLYWIPRALHSWYGGGAFFRAVAFGVLAAAVVFHVSRSWEVYGAKTFPVGSGGDTILTYNPSVFSPGPNTTEALRWIDAHVPPGATLVSFPEGIMLNYLSRHPTTLRQMNFMMTEALIFGEDTIVRELAARPPDYVALVDKDTSEFGVGPFGADPHYGQRIMAWISQHYETATLIGPEPFQGKPLGIKILKRTE